MFDDLEYESPRHELQRKFAANLYRTLLPKYEAALGHAAVVNFTRWWCQWRTYRTITNQFARTQREFNIEAQSAVDGWLNTWVRDTTQKIIDGEPEVAPTPEDDVERIKSAWGVDEAVKISEVIRKGIKKYVPELRNKDATYTGKSLLFPTVISPGESNAVQDAWVKLLTKSKDTINGPEAFSAGGSAGREIVRKDARIIPISQLQSADPDAPETTLNGVQKFLTEEDYQRDVDYQSEKEDAAEQDAIRLAILNQFRKDQPEDYAFVVAYLTRVEREPRFRGGRIISVSKRGAKATPDERKRAHNILSGLQKWEQSLS